MSETDNHVFKTSLEWTGDRIAKFTSPDRPPLEGASPPEVDGLPGYWNPEELLVGSYELCLLLTFIAVTKKFRIDFSSYESAGAGILEKGEKYFAFTKVSVKAKVGVPADADLAKFGKAVEVTKKACFITNSLNCETGYEVEFVPGK